MDRRARIESPTEIRDAYGAVIPGWSEVATVWASVLPMTPRELVADSAQVAVIGYRVTIRYRSGILPSYRIVVDGKTLLIRGIAEIGRREFLQIICEQVT